MVGVLHLVVCQEPHEEDRGDRHGMENGLKRIARFLYKWGVPSTSMMIPWGCRWISCEGVIGCDDLVLSF